MFFEPFLKITFPDPHIPPDFDVRNLPPFHQVGNLGFADLQVFSDLVVIASNEVGNLPPAKGKKPSLSILNLHGKRTEAEPIIIPMIRQFVNVAVK